MLNSERKSEIAEVALPFGPAGNAGPGGARANVAVPATGGAGLRRLVRWSFVAAGLGFVGIGAIGVLLPGVPTVGPLLIACWFFSKSCPHLEQRFIRTPFFAPFLRYLDGEEAMSVQARLVAIAGMWVSIGISSWGLVFAGTSNWAIGLLVALGLVGTVFIWRFRSELRRR